MANTDAATGLRPIRHRNGAAYNGSVNPYFVNSSYATALFIGDAVTKNGTSNTALVKDNGIGTLPEVELTAVGTGNAITGVIVGFEPDPDNLTLVHRPLSTERIAWLCDDPDVVFEIQADSDVPAADIGLNAVLIYTNSGSTVTGLSGAELDTGTTTAPAADAAFQLTIQRIVNRIDVDETANTKLEVRINNHTEAHGVVGIS